MNLQAYPHPTCLKKKTPRLVRAELRLPTGLQL